MKTKKLNRQDAMHLFSVAEQELRDLMNDNISEAQRNKAALALDATTSVQEAIKQIFGGEGDTPGVGASATALAMEEIERRPHLHREFDPVPTFVIGYRRSGTTLLAWLLDSHPNISFLPENMLCRAIFDCAIPNRLSPILQAGSSLRWILSEPRRVFFGRLAQLVSDVYSDYTQRKGKPRWVAKLFLPYSIDLLDMAFDYQAKFIYMVRHGFDVAFSASERFELMDSSVIKSGLGLANYLEEWRTTNEALMSFASRNSERCLTVRYEDLITNPTPIAQEVFAFINEPWIPTILDDMREQEHGSFGDSKIHQTGGKIDSSRRNRWHNWPDALVQDLAAIANPTLARLGYDPVPITQAHPKPTNLVAAGQY